MSLLPSKLKMRVLNEKYLLKEAVGALIPETIRRRHKQPYRAPDSQSFLKGGRSDTLLDYVDEVLSLRALSQAGLFDAGRVGKLVEKVRAGQAIGVKDNMAFVGILSAQLVVDRFITNFPREYTL